MTSFRIFPKFIKSQNKHFHLPLSQLISLFPVCWSSLFHILPLRSQGFHLETLLIHQFFILLIWQYHHKRFPTITFIWVWIKCYRNVALSEFKPRKLNRKLITNVSKRSMLHFHSYTFFLFLFLQHFIQFVQLYKAYVENSNAGFQNENRSSLFFLSNKLCQIIRLFHCGQMKDWNYRSKVFRSGIFTFHFAETIHSPVSTGKN